jgi:hypothetical protein
VCLLRLTLRFSGGAQRRPPQPLVRRLDHSIGPFSGDSAARVESKTRLAQPRLVTVERATESAKELAVVKLATSSGSTRSSRNRPTTGCRLGTRPIAEVPLIELSAAKRPSSGSEVHAGCQPAEHPRPCRTAIEGRLLWRKAAAGKKPLAPRLESCPSP